MTNGTSTQSEPPEWRPDPGDEVPDNAAESYYCVVVARTR
jgi:hypothetical protein